MTNFEYYIVGGRKHEGWYKFYNEDQSKIEGDNTIDKYNNWLLREHEEPILDDTEKEYLSNVIKPFRNRVSSIAKVKDLTFSDVNYYIDIHIDNDNDFCFLPSFKPSTGMYKNMEVNRKYTLKELGL
jgi:hypothetical protein